MIRTHKIRLRVNNKQDAYLAQCSGTARYAYNKCLEKWNADYASDNQTRHNFYSIKKWFNSQKKENCPWVYGYSKWVCDYAILYLAQGFTSFFKGNAKHPRFHKKGEKESFTIDGSVVKIEGKILHLPKKQSYKMTENLRFDAIKICSVTILRQADRWFVSICCEVPDMTRDSQSGYVGIDLGIKELATLSDGTVVHNLRWLQNREKRLKHLQRELARKQKGSRNYAKAKKRLVKYHYHTACQRRDYLHKATTDIANRYEKVFMEDLNVSDMQKNHYLAKSISDASFNEFVRQIEYKTCLEKIDRFYPSSKTCSSCGYVQDMPLHKRTYDCPYCGLSLDRDLNASINIRNVGMANYPELMPVEELEAFMAETSAKQESSNKTKKHSFV